MAKNDKLIWNLMLIFLPGALSPEIANETGFDHTV